MKREFSDTKDGSTTYKLYYHDDTDWILQMTYIEEASQSQSQ